VAACQRGEWSSGARLTLRLSLGPSLTRWSHGRPRRPDPPRGRGPRWVRTASVTAGPWRARAVTVGERGSQVTCRSPPRPRPPKQPWTGFEPLSLRITGRLALELSCHYRAIHSGLDRSPADNHGQRHAGPDLRRFLLSQVSDRADLALQARGRLVEPALASPCYLLNCGHRRGQGLIKQGAGDSTADQGQPVYTGGCPWPRPRQGSPLARRLPAGLACRGQPAGVCLATQGPATRSAAAPTSGHASCMSAGLDSAVVLPN
jgi:hypothetical protein